MDCDFRKGEVAKAIGSKGNQKTLSAVLSGAIHIPRALLAVRPNLWELPAGAVPSDPVAMLASQEIATLL